jgi:hypothetical protein
MLWMTLWIQPKASTATGVLRPPREAAQGLGQGRLGTPVTEYIRFEYDITFTNIAAGERVRWLPRRRASALALPGNDCWLLDGERVVFNHFTGDGDETECEWSDDPAVVKLCATAFESVWERAIPHDAYRPD